MHLLRDTSKHECFLVKDIVQRGVWYLQRAQANLERYWEYENLQEVLRERSQILVSLMEPYLA